MLLSSHISHSYILDELRLFTVVPIPKGNNADFSDSNNYRGCHIGLTSPAVLANEDDAILLSPLPLPCGMR